MRGVMKGIRTQSQEEREKSFAENGYYVTTFTTAGFVGNVTNCAELKGAKSEQKYQRSNYPSVRILTREELSAVFDRETAERMASYEFDY